MNTTATISKYEIERGKPMPSKLHSFVQTNLVLALSPKYKEKYQIFSELTLELPSGRSTPDLSIYPKMKIDFLEDEIRMKEPPLGAIEILSPSQGINEILARTPKFFAAGVQSVWVVIPNFKTIYVFNTEKQYETFTDTDTLKDEQLEIVLPLAEIFPTD